MIFKLCDIIPPENLITVDAKQHPMVITGISADSRKIKQDFIYVALKGTKHDGYDYIPNAIKAGATAVICDLNHNFREIQKQYPHIALMPSPFPRYILSYVLGRMNAPLPEYLGAVTGTNGKTSVADFVRQMLELLDYPACSIGTLGMIADGHTTNHHHTTPDPEILYPALRDMKQRGINHAIFEASSHGLEQQRLHGLTFKVGAFTNFTRDHLDYHIYETVYFEAKCLLFDDLIERGGYAVICADDARFEDVKRHAERTELNIISVGKNGTDVTIHSYTPLPHGQILSFTFFGKEYDLTLPLCGEFQASNALIAVTMVKYLASNHDNDTLIALLEKLKPVDGRLDYVGTFAGGNIYVDYAHTPDALEKAILALKPHTTGKIITVFGCGGDRDKGKRPQMGKIAQTLSDIVIVTDDNPRTEEAHIIRQEILEGCDLSDNLLESADRKDAIAQGLDLLQTGDSMLVAGKGHEDGQIIGTTTYPFKDADVIRKLITQKTL